MQTNMQNKYKWLVNFFLLIVTMYQISFGLGLQSQLQCITVEWRIWSDYSRNETLNPKDTWGGYSNPQATIQPIAPFVGIGAGPLISLNSSMSIPVILPQFWGPTDARVNFDHQFCPQILTHFGIFDPLIVKKSTLTPLCFMF